MTTKEAIERLRKYCAYQERCHQEVRTKLLKIKVYGDQLEEVMAELIDDGFLNEERFACSFARGKFKIKHWGRTKIKSELKKRYISAYCINKALEEIDEKEYQEVLVKILQKYISRQPHLEKPLLWKKASNYAIRKGYESNQVRRELHLLL